MLNEKTAVGIAVRGLDICEDKVCNMIIIPVVWKQPVIQDIVR